jgi:hypothetical protein
VTLQHPKGAQTSTNFAKKKKLGRHTGLSLRDQYFSSNPGMREWTDQNFHQKDHRKQLQ